MRTENEVSASSRLSKVRARTGQTNLHMCVHTDRRDRTHYHSRVVILLLSPHPQSVPCLVTLQDFSCGPGGGLAQNFWWAIQVRFSIIFGLRIVHFGIVWLWHIIRQCLIYLNFLRNVSVHSWSLARSAAHPQLRVLRCFKHGTALSLWRWMRARVTYRQRRCFQAASTWQLPASFHRTDRRQTWFAPLLSHIILTWHL